MARKYTEEEVEFRTDIVQVLWTNDKSEAISNEQMLELEKLAKTNKYDKRLAEMILTNNLNSKQLRRVETAMRLLKKFRPKLAKDFENELIKVIKKTKNIKPENLKIVSHIFPKAHKKGVPDSPEGIKTKSDLAYYAAYKILEEKFWAKEKKKVSREWGESEANFEKRVKEKVKKELKLSDSGMKDYILKKSKGELKKIAGVIYKGIKEYNGANYLDTEYIWAKLEKKYNINWISAIHPIQSKLADKNPGNFYVYNDKVKNQIDANLKKQGKLVAEGIFLKGEKSEKLKKVPVKKGIGGKEKKLATIEI
ncbi:hypothetical protein JXB01_02685 [Candidatus Micrarchaeota archaeon]|nr:hypothetical protein [Candidatus Micrarchaeota archaeon]